jgi:hypothetical protein
MTGNLFVIENTLNEFNNLATTPKERAFSIGAQFFHLNK